MDQEQKEEGIGAGVFLRLLKEMVGRIVQIQNGEAFLSWMRAEATLQFPEVFGGLPDPARRALATELGRQVWNVTPLPKLDFRPSPLRRPRPGEPCPCGSGREYGRCCAGAPAVPGLRPELVWALMAAELPLDQAAALAEEGRIPRPYIGIVGRRLTQAGLANRALALLQPLFADPELVNRSDLDTFDALVSAYEELGRDEEVRSFIERFRNSFLFNPEPAEE